MKVKFFKTTFQDSYARAKFKFPYKPFSKVHGYLYSLTLKAKQTHLTPFKYYSPISEFQNFICDDSYVGQPQPRIAVGVQYQTGTLYMSRD